MRTYNLVLCESPDGWSLHEPGSSDDAIASGDAPYILCGAGVPTQRDYDRARKVLRMVDAGIDFHVAQGEVLSDD